MANTKADNVFESGTQFFNEFTKSVQTQTRQFWLAGIGAYAKAGKDSMDFFKDLVAEGEKAEKKGKALFSEQAENVNEKLDELKSRVEDATGGRLGQMVSTLEERRADLYSRVGIPSSTELEKLSAKLDALTATLNKAQVR